jgi:signal transduction histidine kinase/ActR/RegA family two-component response regulator
MHDERGAWNAVHPDDLPGLKEAVRKALDSRGQYEKVVRMPGPEGGYIWIEVRGRVVCDQQGKAVAVRGTSLDITQRKRAEDALVVANRRKDDFLAMLAHELRNPLAPIATAAEILQRIPVEPRVRELSRIIGRQSEHMNNLVHDLLDVSRVTRGLIKLERKPVPVAEIVAGAVEQVRSLIDGRHHTLQLEADGNQAWIDADPTRMVQVVANLLNNAAKYTPEGGRLVLATEADAQDVCIRVRDNGIGIAPELQPHVFELFIQAERSPDRSQGGLGLGLTLVRALTELHGGSVAVHSGGAGQGSEFTIRLPRIAAPAALQAPAPAAQTPAADGRESAVTVLVVDDNADAANSLAMLLEAGGYTVAVEFDAQRALQRAAREGPQVLLLDIGLPQMDGYELARRLRATPATHEALLIAVTGYGQAQDRALSRAAGFDYHLVKPVDVEQLMRMLKERVGTGRLQPSQ